MENSTTYLKKLMELYSDEWKKRLDSYLKNDVQNMNEADEQYFSDFINTYKEEVLTCKASNIQKTEKLIDNDLLFNDLNTYIDNLLSAYHAIEPLRVLEVTDYNTAVKMIDCIFEQAIIRYNPDIDNNFSEYGLSGKEAFINVISVLSVLSSFTVSKNLYPGAIYDAVYQNTRLSQKMCQYITDKINQNFEQIRLKLIIEKLYPSNS